MVVIVLFWDEKSEKVTHEKRTRRRVIFSTHIAIMPLQCSKSVVSKKVSGRTKDKQTNRSIPLCILRVLGRSLRIIKGLRSRISMVTVFP